MRFSKTFRVRFRGQAFHQHLNGGEALRLSMSGAKNQPDRPAALRCQLQTARKAIVQPVQRGQHGCDGGTSQRLIRRPEGILLGGGSNDDQATQRDSVIGSGGGVELVRGVDPYDRPMISP